MSDALEKNNAKIEVNAWRKRRSYADADNSLLSRRMSQGEKI